MRKGQAGPCPQPGTTATKVLRVRLPPAGPSSRASPHSADRLAELVSSLPRTIFYEESVLLKYFPLDASCVSRTWSCQLELMTVEKNTSKCCCDMAFGSGRAHGGGGRGAARAEMPANSRVAPQCHWHRGRAAPRPPTTKKCEQRLPGMTSPNGPLSPCGLEPLRSAATENLAFVFCRCLSAHPRNGAPGCRRFTSTPRFLDRDLKRGVLRKGMKSDTDTALVTTRRLGPPDVGSWAHTRGTPIAGGKSNTLNRRDEEAPPGTGNLAPGKGNAPP